MERKQSQKVQGKNAGPLGKGVAFAVILILLWVCTFCFALFGVDLSQSSWFLILLLGYGLTFLFVGLFITAHDSMHGSVAPEWPGLNQFLGALCAALYGAFTLAQLRTPHFEHHRFTATNRDPDYDGGEGRSSVSSWWLRFFWRYFKVRQLVVLAALANVLIHGLGVSDRNVIVFWVLPSILSSLQLFYFGTYLPHRRLEQEPHRDRHASRSHSFPVWLSFVTCYHFGYHWEHHAAPQVPWWGLPAFSRKLRLQREAKRGDFSREP